MAKLHVFAVCRKVLCDVCLWNVQLAKLGNFQFCKRKDRRIQKRWGKRSLSRKAPLYCVFFPRNQKDPSLQQCLTCGASKLCWHKLASLAREAQGQYERFVWHGEEFSCSAPIQKIDRGVVYYDCKYIYNSDFTSSLASRNLRCARDGHFGSTLWS